MNKTRLRKYRRGATYWFDKSRIWLPNKKVRKRGGTLLRKVYNKLRRGKGFTWVDITGRLFVGGRQLY